MMCVTEQFIVIQLLFIYLANIMCCVGTQVLCQTAPIGIASFLPISQLLLVRLTQSLAQLQCSIFKVDTFRHRLAATHRETQCQHTQVDGRHKESSGESLVLGGARVWCWAVISGRLCLAVDVHCWTYTTTNKVRLIATNKVVLRWQWQSIPYSCQWVRRGNGQVLEGASPV